MRVEVLCVGSELLEGRINTHMSFLAPQLRGTGLPVSRETTVGDSVSEIRQAVCDAVGRSEVVLVTGGLGPTFDDLTREGVAEALGLRLVYRPAIFEGIRRRFLRYGRHVPRENERQAYVIEGAVVLPNGAGSAPGQRVTREGKTLFLLPGPANEMMPMVLGQVLPFLRRRYSGAAARTVLHLCGIPESAADERLDPLYRSAARRGVEFTILSEPGLVDLHITASAPSHSLARRRVRSAAGAARRLVGKWLFGADEDTLESVVGEALLRRRWTLALAESCTGGLLAQRITSVSGSSRYFKGGLICYADETKERELEVPAAVLKRFGAVSEPCARAMAEGARRRWGTDCSAAITGIAGPGGDTRAKPVGLTYLAVSRRGAPTAVERWQFPGDRDAVRQRAAIAALSALLRAI